MSVTISSIRDITLGPLDAFIIINIWKGFTDVEIHTAQLGNHCNLEMHLQKEYDKLFPFHKILYEIERCLLDEMSLFLPTLR